MLVCQCQYLYQPFILVPLSLSCTVPWTNKNSYLQETQEYLDFPFMKGMVKGKKKTTNTINKMLLHSKTRTILKQPCHSSLTFHKLQLPLAQALFNPLNPLTPVSDQDQISPYNINTILTR